MEATSETSRGAQSSMREEKTDSQGVHRFRSGLELLQPSPKYFAFGESCVKRLISARPNWQEDHGRLPI
jgi:hypothetical protein